MYLMDQVEDHCVQSFLARQHFVPFKEEQLVTAQKLEIWATSFTDPGPDYCVFKLYDSNRQLIAENTVNGY